MKGVERLSTHKDPDIKRLTEWILKLLNKATGVVFNIDGS